MVTLVFTAMTACSTLPPNENRTASTALTDTAGSKLGKVAAAAAPSSNANDPSGFRLIGDGRVAFGTLYTLIANAERSLDLQYYIIEDDPYSRALLRAARLAADRGVRVRLLIDDLYTTGKDDRIAWYSSHPNIDVRVFNPFGYGRRSTPTRFAASVTDLGRINHRMHNKLLVADNAFAVTGGRNVGAEYYMHSDKTNFLDLDVLVAGPAVKQLSEDFDAYWNSHYAYPIETLYKRSDPTKETVDTRALQDPNDPVIASTAEAKEMGAPLDREIAAGRVPMIVAPAEMLVDRPSKVNQTAPKTGAEGLVKGETIASDVIAIAKTAQSELIVVSPYFVPGVAGMKVIQDLVARGVKVRVLTNSLAATDAAVVHIGYSHYREPLLKMGVEIYELRPQPGTENAKLSALGSSKASLHAKVLLVDRKTVFIGSFNVDQRSTLENTELGLHIESEALAGQIFEQLRQRGEESRYKLRLSDSGEVQWVTRDDGKEQVLDDEPEASATLKLTLRLLAPFAPEQLL